MNNLIRNLLLSATGATLLLTGCTEQRANYFPQGTGENLIAMKGYKVAYTLKTDKKKRAEANLTEASYLLVKENSMGFKKFDVVDYTTDSDLLPKDYQFIGLTDRSYKLRYKFDDKYILIQKLVNSDTAPEYEIRSFRTKKNNNYLDSNKTESTKATPDLQDKKTEIYVTMVGCPVQYYRVENRLNRNQQATSALAEISVRYPDEATHFRVKKENCKRFAHAALTDIYPKSYFTGEWYYSETIIDTSRDMKSFQGFELNQKSRYKQASRVEFDDAQYSIRVIDTNITDEERKKKEDAKKRGREEKGVEERPIVTIPLKNRYSFSVDENDSLNEIPYEKTHWQDREYVQLDLKKLRSNNFQIQDENAEALDFEVEQDKNGNDYFAVVINNRNSGARVKYAFRKINENSDGKNKYEPRNYFQDDNNLFGYFTTAKTFFVTTTDTLSQDDIDKNFLLARHNVKKGKIEYRFTHNSPLKYRPAAIRALKAWEDAFKKAGINVSLVIDTNAPDVSLGDLRYNIINLIDESGGRFLLGYGPSVIDTKTGEIVSATANIRVSAIRENEAMAVSDYVREKIGFFENNYPCLVRNLTISEDKKFPKEYGIPVQSARNKNCNTFRTLYYNKFKLIEDKCPKLKSYAEARVGRENRNKFISGSENLFNDEGKELLNQCIDEVMQDQLMGTLVHELGHNLGLRHNFRGSADKANFWNDEWIKSNMPEVLNRELGASIMDYESSNGEALRLPGKYDVAALMFGYGGKNGNGAVIKSTGFKENTIEEKDLIQLDPKKSIEGNLKDQKLSIKDIKGFGFCTDEDVEAEMDPMCNRHDKGTTPLEVTLNRMAQIENYLATAAFRYDRPFNPVRDQAIWILLKENLFQPLRRIYEEARWQLESRGRVQWGFYKKIDNVQKIKDYENNANATRGQGKNFEHSYQATSKAIFDFLLNLATLPNKYCVGIKNNKLKLLELNFIRHEMFSFAKAQGQKIRISSCEDDEIQRQMKNEFDQYLGEYGFEIDDVAYLENQADRDRRPLFDVAGTRNIREAALEHLVRWQPAKSNILSDVRSVRRLFPRFMDEPHYRHKIYQTFADRLFHGVIVAPLGLDAKPTDAQNSIVDANKLTFLSYMPENASNSYIVTLPKFKFEAPLLSYLSNTFKERIRKMQGSTGFEVEDKDGATMIDVEISDQNTSACFSGQKLPRADLTIEEILQPKKPIATEATSPGMASGTTSPTAEAPIINKTYICPKDIQYSYMARSSIERFNESKERYVSFLKNRRVNDLDSDLLGIELQTGLELLKRFMEPGIDEWGQGK